VEDALRALRCHYGSVVLLSKATWHCLCCEIGMGFIPDFFSTGRQNVFMGAATAGFWGWTSCTAYARNRAFAEIGEYIEPAGAHLLQRHADGALAFSVATARRPDG